jgi:rhodanese-related sulfurtransferase
MLRHLRSVLVVLVAALGLAALSSCSSGSGNGSTLSVDDFAARTHEAGVVVLDVRTPDEFAAGHLAGAVNVDVESADFGTQISALDKETPYAVYCRSGNRSKVAMSAMTDAGFTEVADLDGGITAWAAAGNAVVTG